MASEQEYKVIIVDDDSFLVDMYAAKFGNVGISVEACKSGTDLIEKLKTGLQADLVLLDIVMPNLTGIETLNEVRNQKLAENTPIVMLTNQNDEENINEAKKLGVSGYIVKSAATPSEVVNEVLNIIKNTKKN